MDNVMHLRKFEDMERATDENLRSLQELKRMTKKNEAHILSLQQDVRSKNTRILELEQSRVEHQQYLDNQIMDLEKRLKLAEEFLTEQASLLDCESNAQACRSKVVEMLSSLAAYKSELKQTTDSAQSFEFEQRASRETIMRLSGELNRERVEKRKCQEGERSVQQELQQLKSDHEGTESQVRLLQERVQQLTASLQRAHSETVECATNMKRIKQVENGEQDSLVKVETTNHKYEEADDISTKIPLDVQAYLNDFAVWLRLSETKDAPEVLCAVWNKIQQLETEIRNRTECTENLKEYLTSKTHEEAHTKAREKQLRERLEILECQRAHEGARFDKVQEERDLLHERMYQVAKLLKIDETLTELGLDALSESLIGRIDKLIKGDIERQASQRVQITRLQREVRQHKERTDSLELQISIMRRRLAESEDARLHPITPASQTPKSLAAADKERRRLSKHLEQSRVEVKQLTEEVVSLKAQLLDEKHDQVASDHQSKVMRNQENKLAEVKRCCEELKAREKHLHHEVEHLKAHHIAEIEKLKKEMTALQVERQSTMNALQVSQQAEKRLLDFRSLVARELGLDCTQLGVPDYEILNELNQILVSKRTCGAGVPTNKNEFNWVYEDDE